MTKCNIVWMLPDSDSVVAAAMQQPRYCNFDFFFVFLRDRNCGLMPGLSRLLPNISAVAISQRISTV